jgi:hypothetical protein
MNAVQSNTISGVFVAYTATNLTDKEGYLVKLTGATSGTYPVVALVSAATDNPVFVLEDGANGSTTAAPVNVRPIEPGRNIRAKLSGTCSPGDPLYPTSAGKVSATGTAGDTIVGYAEETGADGQFVKFRTKGVGTEADTQWYDGAGVTLADSSAAFVVTTGTTNGTKFGATTSNKVGFFNTTPAVQPSSANQTAVTDNSGGSVSDATAVAVTANAAITDNTGGSTANTWAVGAAEYVIAVPAVLPTGTGAADQATAIVIPHKFAVIGWQFMVTVAGVGAGASRVFNLEIGSVDVGTVPSTVTLTEAGTAAVGAITASTAVSGANTGAAGATLSVEVANGGTAFTAGQGVFLVTLKNMDTADAIAGIATGLNAVRTAIGNLNDNFAKGTELTNATRSALVTLGLIKGSA